MKLALLIDADNIKPSDAEEIFTIAKELGDAITRRAFGNVTAFTGKDGWKEAVREYGIEACPQVTNIDRKNTADFALIIDAMDLLHSGRYDGFVLVSSDSDFTSLAHRLRNEGKVVYGIGDDRAPKSFCASCTKFFEVRKKEDKATEEPAQKESAPSELQQNQPSAPENQPKKVTPSSTGKTEFKTIVAALRKQKCKKLQTLRNSLKNCKKEGEEAERIIRAMKNGGYISVDENDKITWLDKKC